MTGDTGTLHRLAAVTIAARNGAVDLAREFQKSWRAPADAPVFRYAAERMLAEIALGEGRNAAGLARAEAASANLPLVWQRELLGYALARNGRFGEAIRHFGKAVQYRGLYYHSGDFGWPGVLRDAFESFRRCAQQPGVPASDEAKAIDLMWSKFN